MNFKEMFAVDRSFHVLVNLSNYWSKGLGVLGGMPRAASYLLNIF